MIAKEDFISRIQKRIYRDSKDSGVEKLTVSAKNNQIIKAFVQDQAVKPDTFNSHISKNDEMVSFGLQHFNGSMDRTCFELFTIGILDLYFHSQPVTIYCAFTKPFESLYRSLSVPSIFMYMLAAGNSPPITNRLLVPKYKQFMSVPCAFFHRSAPLLGNSMTADVIVAPLRSIPTSIV